MKLVCLHMLKLFVEDNIFAIYVVIEEISVILFSLSSGVEREKEKGIL